MKVVSVAKFMIDEVHFVNRKSEKNRNDFNENIIHNEPITKIFVLSLLEMLIQIVSFVYKMHEYFYEDIITKIKKMLVVNTILFSIFSYFFLKRFLLLN